MNMKKLLIVITLSALALIGCESKNVEVSTKYTLVETKEPTVDIKEQVNINDAPIVEDESVYSADEPENIVCFYVTVRKGAAGSETDHTFSEVNSVKKFEDEEHVDVEVKADALVQVGDVTGPLNQMLGYGETINNATIEVRGNSTSAEPQKSYTLRLYDNTTMWRSQKKIALVKSVFDSTRFRNKLFFDLLKDVPDVPSSRTQFVRLFIKDETSGESAYTDYGFFTQVETPNKRYLNNHGLDGSGYLYKARSFNFETNDLIKNFDDPNFDLAKFETVLSCNGNEDNTNLLEMIDAVNDTSKDIDTVVDKYFDRDNYLTWLAYNILMGNIDTTMQNFYLYSPLNGDKWYFIPWDGDGSLYGYEYEVKDIQGEASWEKGISNYWGVILHQKFLSIESNRQQLTEKIELLKNQYLTKEKVSSMITLYDGVVGSYAVSMPDLLHQKVTPEQRTEIIKKLYDEIEINYKNYYETLEGLMPFFLYGPVVNQGSVNFTWGESYDMQSKLVNYVFSISTTPDFSNIVYQEDNIRSFSIDVGGLVPGTYYWKVIATTDDGRMETAFNQIYANGEYYEGEESLVIQ